ncbi:MAG: CotH kinase family protein [bacterium]
MTTKGDLAILKLNVSDMSKINYIYLRSILFFIAIAQCVFSQSKAQTKYDDLTTNLPIIIIDTQGQDVPDDYKIMAKMKVINHGAGILNHSNDADPEYDGFIGIEIRGRFSAWFPQKPYGIETRDSLGVNLNVSLLGMPEENDWILIPNYNDKSFVRNLISFDLFNMMGHYASRAQLCEVIVNSDYRGIYVFCEKIKPDNDRIDINKLTPDDNSGEAVTGGYVISVDYYEGNDNWISSYPPFYYPNRKVHYNYVYPKPDEITSQQKTYIKNYIKAAEGTLYGNNFSDSINGYAKYVDVPSFIDYFILSEVSRNVDGYKKSRFFFKDRTDRDSLLHAGPVWDFDWAWKNITECIFGNTDGSGWSYLTNDCLPSYAVPDWHIRLLQDGNFTYRLIDRYWELREGILSLDAMYNFIDSVAADVDIAKDRHFELFPIDNSNAAPEVEPPSQSYEEEIAKLKEWIRRRIIWLDKNIPALTENIIVNNQTEEIQVINPGFEQPGTEKIKGWDGACSDPNWTGLVYDIPGWSSDGTAYDSGVEDGMGATEGTWTGFLMGNDDAVFQLTDYQIQPDDIIELKVDAKITYAADLLEMSLFYQNDSGNKINLVSKNVNITSDMVTYVLSLSVSGNETVIGRKLGIMFDNVSSNPNSWLGLDNIKLIKYLTTEVSEIKTIPDGFALEQNYPNPFNPTTTIRYSIAPVETPYPAKSGQVMASLQHVMLKIYDVLGREIATLVDEYQSAGIHHFTFNTLHYSLPSGVYFYTLHTGDLYLTKKMMLIK